MNIDSNQTYQYTNHLVDEKSPYLLQHAHNPVNWYPWSDEAFQKARSENKPIFLSIGYSTCHWCHVMERESFEDDEVAELLNEHFISIKVDREERPDLDNIYMSYCHATGGHGGWPLSVFITPEKKPFYVGTYYPKKSKRRLVGFMDVLKVIYSKWKEDQESIEQYSDQMLERLQESHAVQPEEDIRLSTIHEAYHYFEKSFDSVYGGFGKAPKFPSPHNLLFLLRYSLLFEKSKATEMVEKTLEQMYRGGIFDHLGGGFSRYSTDEKWLAPHFEKMLYDNALLLMAYTEGYMISSKEIYKIVAEKIIGYIQENMTSSEGGFFSAEDADSEGVEGKFYLWTLQEIGEVLGMEDGLAFAQQYGVSEKGNFEGINILNRINGDLNKHPEQGEQAKKLYERRKLRTAPYKDDKILTGWNGLMIASLAIGGKTFGNKNYIESAKKAFAFIQNNLIDHQGRIYARYRGGEKRHLGYLDDYAFMIWAAIEMYGATFELDYLSQAIEWSNQIGVLFSDEGGPGFFMNGKDAEQLILQPKEIYDGAIPSGNSVTCYNLLRLAKLTGDQKFQELAEKMLTYFGTQINRSPMMYTFMLTAKLFEQSNGVEMVLAGKPLDGGLQNMIDQSRKHYMPFTVTLLNFNPEEMKKVNPFAATQIEIEGQATAYICEGMACKQPVTDINGFIKQLPTSLNNGF